MAVGKTSQPPVALERMPRHIAFIMDGNGRWAKKRNLPRVEGHRAGSKAMNALARYAGEIGVEAVTFYAFSTENWKRSEEEVAALMRLLEEYLEDLLRQGEKTARLRVLGSPDHLSQRLRQKIEAAQVRTAANTGITVNVAFNYGARDELVRGIKSLAEQCVQGTLSPETIDEGLVSASLYTAGQPDPDLIVRPSGEKRLSNFMLWQAAYAELVFMDVLWPDFTPQHLDAAIQEYAARERRFGGR